MLEEDPEAILHDPEAMLHDPEAILYDPEAILLSLILRATSASAKSLAELS